MARKRNRIIYGSQSVWCNGEILYRVQTLGSTTTFTSEDIFELGHLDIVDVVDDVPAVAVTLNTNDWGDVKTMAVLAQVVAAKIDMDATTTSGNANLIAGGVTLLHGVSLADFAITCGNLTGVSLWAPIQNECDLGTLADNIDQTLFMDEVYMNSLEFSYTTGANATENYGAETDQKMWLLNDGRFVNWEETPYVTFQGGTFALGTDVSVPVLSDSSLGFLRTTTDGERALTFFDNSENEMTNYAVVSGTAQVADAVTFAYDDATDTMYLPATLVIGAGDIIYSLFAADGYTDAMGNSYFDALTDVNRPATIGALRQGQVEIYLVDADDLAYANAWRLTGVTLTSDLTREPLAELGHLGPYDRPLTLPVPITVTIDTTAGDLEHWARFADRYAEYAAGTMDDIDLADLMASDELKLVVKVFAQTDEEAGGTGANRKLAVGTDLIGKKYFNDGVIGTYAVAAEQEYALKTIVVEHLKITDEAYTLDMGTNATQTFGFRSTNDLYVVKGDVSLAVVQSSIRRSAA